MILPPLVLFTTICFECGVSRDQQYSCRYHEYCEHSMEWGSLDWNSTTAALEALVEKCSEQSGLVSKFLIDNCVLPAGQYLLENAERAVQYTLNGEYEVGSGAGPVNTTDLSLLSLEVPQYIQYIHVKTFKSVF